MILKFKCKSIEESIAGALVLRLICGTVGGGGMVAACNQKGEFGVMLFLPAKYASESMEIAKVMRICMDEKLVKPTEMERSQMFQAYHAEKLKYDMEANAINN